MTQELFVTGYCRCADSHRMVAVETEDGQLTEVDCGYRTCPHASGCPIAQKIRELLC